MSDSERVEIVRDILNEAKARRYYQGDLVWSRDEAREIIARCDFDSAFVREPSDDPEVDRHDCLFCGAYVNTECARCGALIMSMIPGNDARNGCMDVCYRCEIEFTKGVA